MKIGLIYPQSEFGTDPERIREYAQTAEALGYSPILVSDHVLGANPVRSDKLPIGQYTHEHAFQEPLVLLGFLAAATRGIHRCFQRRASLQQRSDKTPQSCAIQIWMNPTRSCQHQE